MASDPPYSSQRDPLLGAPAAPAHNQYPETDASRRMSCEPTKEITSTLSPARKARGCILPLLLLLCSLLVSVLLPPTLAGNSKGSSWLSLFFPSYYAQRASRETSYYNAVGRVTGASALPETLEIISQIQSFVEANDDHKITGARDDGTDQHPHHIKIFSVKNYGAMGDGQTQNTQAFRRAFEAAAEYVKTNANAHFSNSDSNSNSSQPIKLAIVSVQNGMFRIGGTIDLYSYTYLYVDSSAVLMGSFLEQDYPYPSAWESEGNPLYPNGILPILIRAKQQHHVGILGQGVIDGGALPGYIKGYNASIDRFVPHMFRQSTSPPCQGECRPQLVLLEHCDSAVVQDVTLQNSPDWTLHVRGSSNVLLTRLHVRGDWRWPNNDGVDLDSCHNVTLSHSTILTADDSICIKTTKGYGTTNNLWIHDNVVHSRSSAFKIGSSTQEDVTNVFVDRLRVLAGTNRGIGLQHRDAGSISRVHFRNVIIESTELQPTHWWGTGEAIYITSTPRYAKNWPLGRVSHITLENIRAYSVVGTSFVGSRAVSKNFPDENNNKRQEVVAGDDTDTSTISHLAFLDVKLCMNTKPSGINGSLDVVYERPSKDYRPTDIEPELQPFQDHIGLYLGHVLEDNAHGIHHDAASIYFRDSLVVFPPPAVDKHYQSTTATSRLLQPRKEQQQICLAGDSSELPGLGCHHQTFCDF